MALCLLAILLHYMQEKLDQGTLEKQRSTLIGSRTHLGPSIQWTLSWHYHTPDMVLYILAIFLHSMQQKWDEGTLGTQRTTLIASSTRLGPSMDPAMALHAMAGWVVWHVCLHHDLWSIRLLLQEK